MTQDYLNHLFANYPQGDVPQIYWTADGNAFTELNFALEYAKRLPEPTVKVVAHGGKLEDAIALEEGKEHEEPTAEGEKPVEFSEVNLAKLTKTQLQKLCDEKGIVYDDKLTKAGLIELLDAQNTPVEPTPVDYTAMDLEQLQAICKEREIDFAGAEDDVEKLTALLKEWDVQNATEVKE